MSPFDRVSTQVSYVCSSSKNVQGRVQSRTITMRVWGSDDRGCWKCGRRAVYEEGTVYTDNRARVSNELWAYCGYTCSSLTQNRIVTEEDEAFDTSSCRAEVEMPFVRKSPWPKSPTSNLTVSLQELRRSLILVFYFSLLSSHKVTPSKFHWSRHLNSSSHLRGPHLWKHGQVCQDFAW